MWNIFKKKNMVIEQLAKTNAELEKKLIERNNENTTLNRDLQIMTEDRDYWKSQYEEFVKTYDSKDAKLGKKIREWVVPKILKNIQESFQIENLKKRANNAKHEETIEIFVKSITIMVEKIFLQELGNIIIESELPEKE